MKKFYVKLVGIDANGEVDNIITKDFSEQDILYCVHQEWIEKTSAYYGRENLLNPTYKHFEYHLWEEK